MTRLPSTSVAERRTTETQPPLYDLDSWWTRYGVVAGITGANDGFDLGLWGENAVDDEVLNCWQVFQGSFEPRFRQFVVGHQLHGTSVGVCERVGPGLVVREGLDGHATTIAGILLIVLVADCVPVYLLNPVSKAVVLLHAGWRGTAGGILEAGLNQLESLGGTKSADIVMHCGVSVCGDCYEVGPEVIQATCGRNVDCPEALDLRGVLTEQAHRLGIGQVTSSSWCTVHDAGRFHSFRSNGAGAGRMAA